MDIAVAFLAKIQVRNSHYLYCQSISIGCDVHNTIEIGKAIKIQQQKYPLTSIILWTKDFYTYYVPVSSSNNVLSRG